MDLQFSQLIVEAPFANFGRLGEVGLHRELFAWSASMRLSILILYRLAHLQKVIVVQGVLDVVERGPAGGKVPGHCNRLFFINIADLLLGVLREVYFGEGLLGVAFYWRRLHFIL